MRFIKQNGASVFQVIECFHVCILHKIVTIGYYYVRITITTSLLFENRVRISFLKQCHFDTAIF